MRKLFFTLLVFVSANAFGKENMLALQKQSLHSFAEQAAKAKNVSDLLEQSRLHWQAGFFPAEGQC